MFKDVRSPGALPWLRLPVTLMAIAAVLFHLVPPVLACCAVGPRNIPVLNADQAVIILWDRAAQVQHFIRKATFASEAQDFGFLIPSPSRPDLSESGDDAFPFLADLTKPEIRRVARYAAPFGCVQSKSAAASVMPRTVSVQVLEEKVVAGFKAAVLAADSARALVDWLKENGYAFSPEVEAWAKPYVETGWLITALKVAKSAAGVRASGAAAPSLRMSFKTDRPLFPYREPDSKGAAAELNPEGRLLRIYFLGEARYQGAFPTAGNWSGMVAWSGQLGAAARNRALELLKLPATTGPKEFWLTEFEDRWQYANAPGDVYFSVSPDQAIVKRPPHIKLYTVTWPFYAGLLALILTPLAIARLLRRRT